MDWRFTLEMFAISFVVLLLFSLIYAVSFSVIEIKRILDELNVKPRSHSRNIFTGLGILQLIDQLHDEIRERKLINKPNCTD